MNDRGKYRRRKATKCHPEELDPAETVGVSLQISVSSQLLGIHVF